MFKIICSDSAYSPLNAVSKLWWASKVAKLHIFICYILTSISRYIGVNKEVMQVQLLPVGRGSVTSMGSIPI